MYLLEVVDVQVTTLLHCIFIAGGLSGLGGLTNQVGGVEKEGGLGGRGRLEVEEDKDFRHSSQASCFIVSYQTFRVMYCSNKQFFTLFLGPLERVWLGDARGEILLFSGELLRKT